LEDLVSLALEFLSLGFLVSSFISAYLLGTVFLVLSVLD